jgi:hypothetical protein
MRRHRVVVAVIAVAVAVGVVPVGSASAAVVVREIGTSAGYTLLVPQTTTDTHLLDLNGQVVHTWRSGYLAGNSAHLRDDGLLLRAGRVSPVPANFARAPGGHGGVVELIGWDGAVEGSFQYASDAHIQHHDAISLPNGNVAFIAWEFKSAAEAIAAGRDPSLLADGLLLPDSVVEVNVRKGKVVWEWHVWDHLIQDHDPSKPNFGEPADHPGRIDLNWVHDNGGASWNHLNGIAYDAKRDQIIVSSRHFNELWVIDHQTTTKEARGKKGDLIGRFGNPAAYGKGAADDRMLFFQHSPSVLEPGQHNAGRFLVFNNGDASGRAFSSVDEIAPVRRGRGFAMKAGTFRARFVRAYPHATAASTPLFSTFISSVQRLANGNLLINDGPAGRVFEVTRRGTKVWEYRNDYFAPGPTIVFQGFEIRPERLFSVRRYPAAHPAFDGRGLPPASPRRGEYSY